MNETKLCKAKCETKKYVNNIIKRNSYCVFIRAQHGNDL